MYKVNKDDKFESFSLLVNSVAVKAGTAPGKQSTNHFSNELEASRKLHSKHVLSFLINEPLLKNDRRSTSFKYKTC